MSKVHKLLWEVLLWEVSTYNVGGAHYLSSRRKTHDRLHKTRVQSVSSGREGVDMDTNMVGEA